jgi:3'(2'), 5'-bisphosphate nucleotidase
MSASAPLLSPGAETDAQLATRLAVEAGRLLVEMREAMWRDGAHAWDVMDHGDAVAHHFIAHELRTHRPHDAVLDEEGKEDPRRFGGGRVWIIDPLDGTREFGEPGRHDWAVHVALWDGDHFAAGAVSLPAVDLVLSTDPAPILPAVERERPRLITSRNRAPYAAVIVANALGCDAVRLGSAGAKAMAVVLGEADIYVHDGGMYQWDSAAPAAVALAAGLHVSRLDGTPIVYNARDAWLPDLIICRPELADAVLDALWGR